MRTHFLSKAILAVFAGAIRDTYTLDYTWDVTDAGTGTLSWEIEVLKAHGLDKKADLQIDALELASPEAGKIAIKGGSADMFLSDWLYVSRERSPYAAPAGTPAPPARGDSAASCTSTSSCRRRARATAT